MQDEKLVKRSILALDHMNEQEILNNIEKHYPDINYFKIGLEQFCLHGPDLISRIQNKFSDYDLNFFLDLKLHDIPKTVAQAIHSLKGLPISLLTIHLGGGPNMVKAAIEAAKESLPETKILGVSLLTSIDAQSLEQTYGIAPENFNGAFQQIVKMGSENGLEGLVCSINDLGMVKEINPTITTVCPGIRFEDQIASGDNQDQKRVATPEFAKEQDASYIVIGRALTQAGDKWESRMKSLKEL
jgi:orotidine-5'-phosphate decarboxylase